MLYNKNNYGTKEERKMVLYSTGCPQCIGLKSMLDAKGYQYEVCSDVDIMLGKGIKAVPMLETDDTMMSFKEAVKWINGGNQ